MCQKPNLLLHVPCKLHLCHAGHLPGYADAIKLQTLEPHHHAVVPACPHFGPCGGCTLQNLSYAAQLDAKTAQVTQLLARIGKVRDAQAVVQPTIGCQETYHYRNKVQFTFSDQMWVPEGPMGVVKQHFALGFLRCGSSEDVLPIQQCYLQHPIANDVLTLVREWCQSSGLNPHNAATGQGVLRHLIIRSAGGAGVNADAHLKLKSNVLHNRIQSTGSLHSSNSNHNCHDIRDATTLQDREPLNPTTLKPTVPCTGSDVPVATIPSFMVILVTTASCESRVLQPCADMLMAAVPQVVSVVHSMEAPAATVNRRGPGASSASPINKDAHQATKHASTASVQSESHSTAGSRHSVQQQHHNSLNGCTDNGSNNSNSSSSHNNNNGSSSAGSSSGGSGRWQGRALRITSSTVLAGQAHLLESLGGLQYSISPHSFFQTNTRQAEQLYRIVADAAGVSSTDVVLDLYCGTGTIGLYMAGQCKRVIGYDISSSAIQDAKQNAARNGITNAQFVCGNLDQLALKLAQQHVKADVVIVDPARAGLSVPVVQYLLSCGARRVVYVSCNAATQARDIHRLCSGMVQSESKSKLKSKLKSKGTAAAGGDKGHTVVHEMPNNSKCFELRRVIPVDMFPHTDHVETVAVLDRIC